MLAFAVAIGLGLGLNAFLRRTDFGLAVLAAAQDAAAVRMVGVRFALVSQFTWISAGVLGAIAVLLLQPSIGAFAPGVFSAGTSSLFIPALAAALLGGLTDLNKAFYGGLFIGVARGLVDRLFVNTNVLPGAVVDRHLLDHRGHPAAAAGQARHRGGVVAMTRRQLWSIGLAAAFIVLPPLLSRATPGLFSDTTANTLAVGGCWAAMALSLNLLMGYAGQISLGHGALVGRGRLHRRSARRPLRTWPAGLRHRARRRWSAPGWRSWSACPRCGCEACTSASPPSASPSLMENIGAAAALAVAAGSAGIVIPRPYFGDRGLISQRRLPAHRPARRAGAVVDRRQRRAHHAWAAPSTALSENEDVAQSFGVDVTRYKLLAFVVSGAMAGVAGAVYGHLLGVVSSDTFAFDKVSLLARGPRRHRRAWQPGGCGGGGGGVLGDAQFLDFFEGWDLLIGAAL